MNATQFYTLLVIISATVGLGLFLLNQSPQLRDNLTLSWISLGGFFALSILMYYSGRKSAQSENKHDFTSLVLGFTVGKMFLAILIIYSYIQLVHPEGKLFVLPFFGVYLVFTAFETYFMMKLGKSKV